MVSWLKETKEVMSEVTRSSSPLDIMVLVTGAHSMSGAGGVDMVTTLAS